LRGGSWNNNGNNCRSANRNNNNPDARNNNVGFRVVVAALTQHCRNRGQGMAASVSDESSARSGDAGDRIRK
jgi:hypothetical protein